MKIKLSSKADSNPTKIKHRTMNMDGIMNWSALHGHFVTVNLGNVLWSIRDLLNMSDDKKINEKYQGFVNNFPSPDIFYRVIIDILNVIGGSYYPTESLLLNSNPAFILDTIPSEKIRLSYASASGGAGEDIKSVYEKKILPAYDKQGLPFHSATASFVAVTSGKRKTIMQEAEEAFPVSMAKDVAAMLVPGDKDHHPPKQELEQSHFWSVGFAVDLDIGEHIRLSVLSIHPTEE